MHPSRHRQVSVYILSALRPGDGQRYTLRRNSFDPDK
jgi:hypothetical protein